MAIDISGLEFFMPVFSFLFVLIVIYALLIKTKILGEGKYLNLLVSFIFGIIFISFSSMELFVRTIIPWFVVLIIVLFFILFIGGFASNLEDIMKPGLAWVFVGFLAIIFLVAAIKVFNPVFHPDLLISSGNGGTTIWTQIVGFFNSSNMAGVVLLLIIGAVVSWVLTKN